MALWENVIQYGTHADPPAPVMLGGDDDPPAPVMLSGAYVSVRRMQPDFTLSPVGDLTMVEGV